MTTAVLGRIRRIGRPRRRTIGVTAIVLIRRGRRERAPTWWVVVASLLNPIALIRRRLDGRQRVVASRRRRIAVRGSGGRRSRVGASGSRVGGRRIAAAAGVGWVLILDGRQCHAAGRR